MPSHGHLDDLGKQLDAEEPLSRQTPALGAGSCPQRVAALAPDSFTLSASKVQFFAVLRLDGAAPSQRSSPVSSCGLSGRIT